MQQDISIVLLGNNLVQERFPEALTQLQRLRLTDSMTSPKADASMLHPLYSVTSEGCGSRRFHPERYGEISLAQFKPRPVWDVRKPDDQKESRSLRRVILLRSLSSCRVLVQKSFSPFPSTLGRAEQSGVVSPSNRRHLLESDAKWVKHLTDILELEPLKLSRRKCTVILPPIRRLESTTNDADDAINQLAGLLHCKSGLRWCLLDFILLAIWVPLEYVGPYICSALHQHQLDMETVGGFQVPYKGVLSNFRWTNACCAVHQFS